MSRREKAGNKPQSQVVPKITEPVNVSLRLSPALAEKLDAYCTLTGVSRNGVISLAVSDFLADRE